MKAKSQFQSIECLRFHRIKTWLCLTRFRLTEEDFKVTPVQGGAWARGQGGIICVFSGVCDPLAGQWWATPRQDIWSVDSALVTPDQTPGVLVPAPASLPLLCCLYTIMVRDEQTIVCSTRQVISLTLHSPFSFAVCCAVIYLSGSLVALSDTAGRQAHVRCPVSAPANTIIANFPINDFYTILTTLK